MTATARLVGSTALAVLAVATTAVVPASAHGGGSRSGPAQARAATAQFHNVARALEAGYLPTDLCVPGMGYHYVKPDLLARIHRPTSCDHAEGVILLSVGCWRDGMAGRAG